MKRTLLLLLLALLTGGALKAQTSDSSPSAAEPKNLQADDLSVVQANGVYYISTAKASWKVRDGFLMHKLLDSLTYISTVIPEKYWVQAYLQKNLTYQIQIIPIGFELKNLTVRYTISQKKAVTIGRKIFYKPEPTPYANQWPIGAIAVIFLVGGAFGAWVAKRGWKIFCPFLLAVGALVGMYALVKISGDYSFFYLAVPTGIALLLPYLLYLIYFVIKGIKRQKEENKEMLAPETKINWIAMMEKARKDLGPFFPW